MQWRGWTLFFLSVALGAGGLLAGAMRAEELELDGYKIDIPLGLDPYDYRGKVPADNKMSVAKVELGKLLYFDKRLSVDNTVACASCHAPKFSFTDGQPVPTGVKGQKGGRNVPTVINRAFSTAQFLDGRSPSLEHQAQQPEFNPIEMAMPSPGDLEKKLRGIAGYREQFQQAFGTEEITMDGVGKAIAAYERTVLWGNSAFDRFVSGKDEKAVSESAKRGFELFRSKVCCDECHTGFNFTDEQFHNIGVGWDAKKEEFKDPGRYQVTKRDIDQGAFKTPTLRNIAQTAPYMHDGSQKTLEEVVEFYNKGGEPNPNIDEEMRPLHLTDQDKKDLVAFLQSLTGEIPASATTEPSSFPQ